MIGQIPDQEWDEVTTVPELADAVTHITRSALGAHGATFVLRDGDECFYAAEDSASPLWTGQRFPVDQCISGWAMRHAASAVVADIETDPRIPLEAYRPTFVRSLIMCPIGAPEPQAAVGAYWAVRLQPTAALLALLEEVAAAAGRVLDRIGLATAPWAPTIIPGDGDSSDGPDDRH